MVISTGAYYSTIVLLCLSFTVLSLFTFFAVMCRRKKGAAADAAGGAHPKVSLLKPFKDSDDALEENLESFYALDYPDFEILIGVDSLSEPCIPLIEKIRQRHPEISTAIIATGTDKTLNPKVDTLSKLAARASGELYWVSDANIRVAPDTLRCLIGEYFTQGAKIVFSPIRGTGSGSIGSVMENAYVNVFVSGSVLAAWACLRKAIIVGKSMLIEKEALNRIGGFNRFREYLAEDYMMGEIYRESGIAVSTNCTWVTNFNRSTTVKGFVSRVQRWGTMRFHIERGFYFSEILANPVAIALVALPLIGARGAGLLLTAILLKTGIEYINFFAINEGDRKNPWIICAYPLLMLYKDILLFIVYLTPVFTRTVTWRGRRMWVGPKSRIMAVAPIIDGKTADGKRVTVDGCGS